MVGLGLPFAALMLAVVLNLPAASLMIPAIAASFGVVYAMRALAGRASTARILASGKAVTKLVVSGNDDLITAAIDPVVRLDSDPKGAAQLVNELRDAWKTAEASSANEKVAVIAALRETARTSPPPTVGSIRCEGNSPGSVDPSPPSTPLSGSSTPPPRRPIWPTRQSLRPRSVCFGRHRSRSQRTSRSSARSRTSSAADAHPARLPEVPRLSARRDLSRTSGHCRAQI